MNKLLKETFRSYLLDTHIPSLNNKELNVLYHLANINKILPVISSVLNSNKTSNTLFDEASYNALIRKEKQKRNIEELKILLKDYDYVFFKGTAISKYYQNDYERVSADTDIYVFDNYEDVLNTLLNNGYKVSRKDIQEYELIDTNNNFIDLHSSFTLKDKQTEDILKEAKHHNNYLDINYEYLFLIYHTKKHLLRGILDLRSILDIYYLRDKLDKDLINELLNETNLMTFNNSLNHYLDTILNRRDYDDNDLFIEELIDGYSQDDGIKNRILINSYNKNKLEYLLSRVFIDYDLLSNEYPIIKKYKILTPIYYLKRIIRILKSRRSNYALKELKENHHDLESINKMHINLENIGITSII